MGDVGGWEKGKERGTRENWGSQEREEGEEREGSWERGLEEGGSRPHEAALWSRRPTTYAQTGDLVPVLSLGLQGPRIAPLPRETEG